MPFRNITGVFEAGNHITIKSKPEDTPFVLFVETTDRNYMLCCKDEKQREMFYDGFNYVIKSTKIV